MPTWDVVSLTQALVRLPTLPCEELPAVRLLQDVMTELGYDEVRVDDVGNLIGTIGGGQPGCIVLDGHLDIVSAGDEARWAHAPFGGQVDGDFLYGRGATDMKGAVAAMVLAGRHLIKDDRASRQTVRISCSVAEELIEGLAFGYVCDAVRPSAVIIGEPTSLTLAIGQRGRAELCVETIGRSGHSAYPETAVNALDKMVALLPRLRRAPLPDPHFVVGPALLVATDISSVPYPANSVIPESCRVTLDRRLLPGETPDSVIRPLRDAIKEARREDLALEATVEIAHVEFATYRGRNLAGTKFVPGWFVPEDSWIVAQAKAALSSVGLAPHVTSYLACTNGSASAGVRGIPTVGFGPGDDEQSHRTDEWVRISSLRQAEVGYAALARHLSASRSLGEQHAARNSHRKGVTR